MQINNESIKAHATIIESAAKLLQEGCEDTNLTEDDKQRTLQDLAGRILIEAHWLMKEGFSATVD